MKFPVQATLGSLAEIVLSLAEVVANHSLESAASSLFQPLCLCLPCG